MSETPAAPAVALAAPDPAAPTAAALPPIAPGAPVFLLSGQGAQRPGMGADLRGVGAVARAFECASEVLGYDLARRVSEASAEELNRTTLAQPALCALSVGLAHALEERGVRPAAVLGFSLGQVGALAVSGMLSDEATFSFVAERARLMDEAARAHPGAMSALLRVEPAEAAALCEECAGGEVLVAANFNCPGQIVVSGSSGAVERAEAAWASRGGRFSRVATSGAFHSPLMRDAARRLGEYLQGVDFAQPRMPLICNTDARPLAADTAREHLAAHLTSPVLFQQSVEGLVAAGADTFVEVGFGGVLVNLVKRIDRASTRVLVQDLHSLEACAERVGHD